MEQELKTVSTKEGISTIYSDNEFKELISWTCRRKCCGINYRKLEAENSTKRCPLCILRTRMENLESALIESQQRQDKMQKTISMLEEKLLK